MEQVDINKLTTRYYAGIGSRETPDNILTDMAEIAQYLDNQDYILRSGGAKGADSAFSDCTLGCEIYIPWAGFNNITGIVGDSLPTYQQAREFTLKVHPAPHRLSEGAIKLHTRNVFQVLGADLNTPVDFVVCWTKDGKDTGGTGQAIRIANMFEIPVYNLFNMEFIVGE